MNCGGIKVESSARRVRPFKSAIADKNDNRAADERMHDTSNRAENDGDSEGNQDSVPDLLSLDSHRE